MPRWERAVWQPVSQRSPGISGPRGVCLHHQAGSGNPAPIYASRGVSAHFWIPRVAGAPPYQHVDTADKSWHGMDLNQAWLGVETEGCGAPPHADPLTEWQLDLFAELMHWANRVHGIPLQLSEDINTPGLGYHRMRGGVATACPCDVRKNARTEILRRAGGTPPSPGTPPPPSDQEANMTLTDPVTGGVWVATKDGSVFTYDGAPYLGGSNPPKFGNAGKPCVGISANPDSKGGGYVTVHDWGDRGDGKSSDGGDRFRRYRFPRNKSGM